MPSPRISKDNPNGMYFLTITVIEWIDIFTKFEHFQALANSLRFCNENKGLQLFSYVFMTNHIHLIANSPNRPLFETIKDFKRHTTKEIKRLLQHDNRKYIRTLLSNSYHFKKGSSFQIWQRENYAELIESEKFMCEKVNYIHQNPVKKGYVKEAKDWLYSSAAFYEGDETLCNGTDILVPCTTWN